MPTVLIETQGDEPDVTTYGGDVDVWIIRWDAIVNDFSYAADIYDVANHEEEPHRTRIRDLIEEIWPDIANGFTEE